MLMSIKPQYKVSAIQKKRLWSGNSIVHRNGTSLKHLMAYKTNSEFATPETVCFSLFAIVDLEGSLLRVITENF
jgi:hypothetical protein